MRLFVFAFFLGACGGADDEYRGEHYVPGAVELSQLLASSYADPSAASRTMRGVRIERDGDCCWVYAERVLEDGSTVPSVYRTEDYYVGGRYVADVYAVRDGITIDMEAKGVVLDPEDVIVTRGLQGLLRAVRTSRPCWLDARDPVAQPRTLRRRIPSSRSISRAVGRPCGSGRSTSRANGWPGRRSLPCTWSSGAAVRDLDGRENRDLEAGPARSGRPRAGGCRVHVLDVDRCRDVELGELLGVHDVGGG